MNAVAPPVPTPSRDRARAQRGGRSRTRRSGRLHHPTSTLRWPVLASPPVPAERVHRPLPSAVAIPELEGRPGRRIAVEMPSSRRLRIAASLLCTSAVCASSAGVLYLTRDGNGDARRVEVAGRSAGSAADIASNERTAGTPQARNREGADGAGRSGRGAVVPAAPSVRRATLTFTGDVLIHGPVARRAKADAASAGRTGYDFSSMLAPIAPRIAGSSLAICHIETPLSSTNTDLRGYPMFRAPTETAAALEAAGYDGCSVASNHALDTGPKGIGTTLDVMDAAGLRHAGTARSAEEAATPTIYDADGIKVGHLSYSYGFNGFRVPSSEPWRANEIDVDRIVADAAAARSAGAEFVVASLHWGSEYRHDPTAAQEKVANALAATGAVDLVIGHHAHVVQPVTRIGRMWVVYGLGNFLSNNGAGPGGPSASDGLLATVTITDRDGAPAVENVAVTPTYNERGTFRVIPVADALGVPGIDPKLAAELRRSWDRTIGEVMALDGTALGVAPDAVPPGATVRSPDGP